MYMMYFFINAVRNVCGLVGCEGRTTPEHAASASPSSHAAAASAAGVKSGEARGVERKSAKRD